MIMVINEGKAPDGSQYLSPESVVMLGDVEQSSLDIDSVFQPGLGLDSMDDPVMKYAGRAWMKNGGTGDYNSFMEMLPDKKLAAVVLTNSDTGSDLIYSVVRECLKNAVFDKYHIPPSAPSLPTYTTENDPSIIKGIYVKKFGYDKITDNGDDTLTWELNAHSDSPDTAILTYENGHYQADGRTESISFKNIPHQGKDYFLMIQSGSSGSSGDKYASGGYVRSIVGEKVDIPVLSDAWKSRLGIYFTTNMAWNDFRWSDPFSILTEKDNALIANFSMIAVPQNDTLAYMVGIKNRSDSSIRVVVEDGVEQIVFGGDRGISPAYIPAIAVGDTISGTLALFKTDWFRLDTVTQGQTVVFDITTESDHYALTFFDENFIFISREMGAMNVTTQAGSYFIAVTPTPDASGNYTMTVN